MAERFDFSTALGRADEREAYPAIRFQALGKIGREVVCLVFTRLSAERIRIISRRKASKRERSIWLAHHP